MDIKNILECKGLIAYHPFNGSDHSIDYAYIKSVAQIIMEKYPDPVTIIGQGLSCAILSGSVLAIMNSMGRDEDELIMLRKPQDKDSHYPSTPSIKNTCIIIDDFCASGRTLHRIIKKIRKDEEGRKSKIDVFLSDDDFSPSFIENFRFIDQEVRTLYLSKTL